MLPHLTELPFTVEKTLHYWSQGNKRMLGNGWPTKPIVIEGNSVILNFEVKSRREAETMEKSVWGYKALIGAINAEAAKSNLSFFTSTALSLIPILRSILGSMFEGCPKTVEESGTNAIKLFLP